jgi:hypothetical protein
VPNPSESSFATVATNPVFDYEMAAIHGYGYTVAVERENAKARLQQIDGLLEMR